MRRLGKWREIEARKRRGSGQARGACFRGRLHQRWRAMKPDFYAGNRRYAEGLRRDPRQFQSLPALCGGESFYAKYVRSLSEGLDPGDSVLDVGCGVGQVVEALRLAGLVAAGVDVAPPEVAGCLGYDGRVLPFPEASFSAVGAFNVLEHAEEPVAFLDEMARVLMTGGRMVVSSPNFLRVVGWRDYHPRMAGLRQKMRNLRTLLEHAQLYRQERSMIHFEPMEPVSREEPRPDDDATVATSAFDLRRYFVVRGFVDVRVSCVDRPLPRPLEWLLDATPLRYVMLNAFVTARKR
jgi:SAM-dependent methyltransferase